MSRTYQRTVIATLVALGVLVMTGIASAYPIDTAGRTEQQTSSRGLDHATPEHGGWDHSTPGVDGRPYIKSLSVSTSGGPFIPLVVPNSAGNANDFAPTAATIGGNVSDVYAFVSPTNSCNTNQHGSDVPTVCYDTPNRVSIFLAHWHDGGWDNNFTTSLSTNPAITSTSVIDMVISFKAAYSSLRWTWVNGVPSYWSNTVVSGAGGDVHVRFTPKTVPVMSDRTGCSQIPVMTCEIPQASEEDLEASLVLSMDSTLSASLAGTLFGSENAFIGSLDGTPPNLTYGVAAPHLMSADAGGGERRGTFYALMPDSVLSLFGTSVAAFDPAILAVTRTGDAGTFSPAWSTWTATDNGTSGKLLTISNISFSAPKFVVTRSGKNAKPSLRVGEKASLAAIAGALGVRTTGTKLSAKVSTPKICKVVGKAIKGLKAGTCKGTLTIKPKRGKPSKKRFSFAVTGGRRLALALHHH